MTLCMQSHHSGGFLEGCQEALIRCVNALLSLLKPSVLMLLIAVQIFAPWCKLVDVMKEYLKTMKKC